MPKKYMIEIKNIRFVKYDNETKRVHILLLDEDNNGLDADVLVGLPEVMSRETVDYIIMINDAVAKNYTEDEKIDIEKIDRSKLDIFFAQVIEMIIQGRTKSALEIPISYEVE